MINMTIDAICQCTGAQLQSDSSVALLSQPITSVAIDSRAVAASGLFVAFAGEHVDGHRYLEAAQQNGAVAALVEQVQDNQTLPQLQVGSCQQAMADIAVQCRRNYRGKIAAITGSCGKTSTKEMLASILQVSSAVSVTSGNQNNEIGVPLTLFNLDDASDYAVVEMGAAQQGDISYLMSMVNPDVSVITNVRPAHVGRFGSEEFIAVGKSEIYRDLQAGGIAIVNLDEKYSAQWLEDMTEVNVLTYSLKDASADVFATDLELGLEQGCFNLHFKGQVLPVVLNVAGEHNIYNALCAASCALALGIKPEDIAPGLIHYSGVASRMQMLEGIWGGRLIDDGYNANPGSVKAAIDVLKNYTHKTILVLGDMAELGDESARAHKNIGTYALQAGIDHLLTLGVESQRATEAFGRAARHFASKTELLSYLKQSLSVDDVVLIKGSRSAALEEIIKPLTKEVEN